MEDKPVRNKSILVEGFSNLIEAANKHFTLSKWFIGKDEKEVFYQIEKMMLLIMVLSIAALLTLHLMPKWLVSLICILLIQRVIEFLVVYSRNFIFGRGRIFTDFRDPGQRGEWLIMMFSVNVLQIAIIFSIWYRSISLLNQAAFSQALTVLDSFYFSIVTSLTVGYGDIIPLCALSKTLVMIQSALTFYTLVIVINGLISIHFIKR